MSPSEIVGKAVENAAVVDLHTHLFPPTFGELCQWGIDEILTYHYLVAETLRVEGIMPDTLFSMPKEHQADLVWDSLFVKRSPLSEATSGVVTILCALGLNPEAPDLREARAFFRSRKLELHLGDVFRLAGVKSVVMTNDPLDPAERAKWDSSVKGDRRFHSSLRIDSILNTWNDAIPKLEAEGFRARIDPVTAVRSFLDHWIKKMNPRYLAVSLPDTFAYPEESIRSRLLRTAVLPACRDHKLPLALMIGVRRSVNPELRSAGDGMGVADLSSLERLALLHPENRFLVTTLARPNVHDLCVVARKFSNVLPFGCWWFMNTPSLVEETTLLRLEMLGPTFVPQHSDARVLEQLIYKWSHSRRAIAAALTTRYEALAISGHQIAPSHIERDVNLLLNGLASDWIGVKA